MKSSLANVGAMALSAKAQELETSSDQNDINFCDSALRPFLKELQKLNKKLKDIFVTSDQNAALTISPELSLILTGMNEAIKNMDYTAINNKMMNLETVNLGDDLRDIIEEIKDAVIIMDYKKAEEMISGMLRRSINN